MMSVCVAYCENVVGRKVSVTVVAASLGNDSTVSRITAPANDEAIAAVVWVVSSGTDVGKGPMLKSESECC